MLCGLGESCRSRSKLWNIYSWDITIYWRYFLWDIRYLSQKNIGCQVNMCCCMTHLGKKAWLLNTAHVGSKDLYTIKISGDFSHIMRESYMRLLINQDRLGDLFFVVYPTTILGHFPSCRARWSCRRMSSDSTFQSSSRPPLWALKFDGDLGVSQSIGVPENGW